MAALPSPARAWSSSGLACSMRSGKLSSSGSVWMTTGVGAGAAALAAFWAAPWAAPTEMVDVNTPAANAPNFSKRIFIWISLLAESITRTPI
jgi:hypothetical protein